MRKLLYLAAFSFSVAAYAQAPATDLKPPSGAAPEEMDPATKARIRTEGATGGIPSEGKGDALRGDASAGSGRPTRSRDELEGQGRVHDETASGRIESRGARGEIRR
jgi:hypothetical protein